MVDGRFKEGLRLFNEGDFFECHEVMEELWLQTPPSDAYRDLYKGVIQAAAALYQFERGILSGALGLFQTATVYLGRYRPAALGLDVDKLIDDLKRCFAGLESWDGKKSVPFPRELVPKLIFHIP